MSRFEQRLETTKRLRGVVNQAAFVALSRGDLKMLAHFKRMLDVINTFIESPTKEGERAVYDEMLNLILIVSANIGMSPSELGVLMDEKAKEVAQ